MGQMKDYFIEEGIHPGIAAYAEFKLTNWAFNKAVCKNVKLDTGIDKPLNADCFKPK
jgi:hypothetical protein